MADLSKAFECVNHKLFIAKVHAYGLDFTSLKLTHNYLNKRKQIVSINTSFTTVLESEPNVLQGSIVGPLFSISIFVICSISLMREKLQTMQVTQIIHNRHDHCWCNILTEAFSKILFKCFSDNLMKPNSDTLFFLAKIIISLC